MNTTDKANKHQGPITIMFIDQVKPEKTQQYESWLNNIHKDMKKAVGFMDVTVIRPGDASSAEYTTLIKFDNYQNLTTWKESDAELKWLSKHSVLVQKPADMQQTSGPDIWFTRPSKSGSGAPVYWKQVILGVITVYPLLLILRVILSPITDHFSFYLSLLVSVSVLSALLTYPVMPYASKLLKNWLYPKD